MTAEGGTAASAATALIAGLEAGDAYINIHTVDFPGGEIRGNLAEVPEPGSGLFLMAGFAVVMFALRARSIIRAQS